MGSIGSFSCTTTYSYDAKSRRTSKQVDSTPAIYYLYDGWNMIADYTIDDSLSLIQNSYSWGMDLSGSMQGAGGVGGLLAVTNHDSQSTDHFFPTYDGNGNVSEYLDASGIMQAHYEYDPFGNTTVSTGNKATDFFHRFSTKPLDAETGLYYYGYRYYDPVTGRWPSRDPIEERGGINLYGMVRNSPINRIDFLGLKDCVIRIVFGHGDTAGLGAPNTIDEDYDNSSKDDCNPSLYVGCGANSLNTSGGSGLIPPNAIDFGAIGLPEFIFLYLNYPFNDQSFDGPREDGLPRTVEPNDCLKGLEAIKERIAQAQATAREHAQGLCEEPCCCKKITIKIEGSEFTELEDEARQKLGDAVFGKLPQSEIDSRLSVLQEIQALANNTPDEDVPCENSK